MKVARITLLALLFVLASLASFGNKNNEARAQIAPPGLCSADNLAVVFGPALSDSEKRAILNARLSKCADDLKGNQKATHCQPQPDSASLADLFTRVSSCAALNAAGPTTPPAPYVSGRSTFYVIAPGASDPVVVNVAMRNVIDQLHQAVRSVAKKPTDLSVPEKPTDTFEDRVWIVGHADWSLKDFANQCANDPTVIGALLLDGLVQQSSGENYLVWATGWTRLNAQAELIACPQTGTNTPQLVAVQHGVEGGGYRNGFPFTVAASIASLFANNKQTTTITSTPSPVPAASPGTTSQTTTTTVTATPALILATIGNSLTTTTLPSLNVTSQLNSASLHFSVAAMNELRRQCIAAHKNIGDVHSSKRPATDFPDNVAQLDKLCTTLNDFTALHS